MTIILVLYSTNGLCHTERNMLSVYINSNNELFVEGRNMEIDALKNIVKEFITNWENKAELAETRICEIKYIGITKVSKGVTSIKCERNTKYGFYIKVHNEIHKAYNEVRNESSLEIFGKPYNLLKKKFQKSINKKIPKRISEAEPSYVWKEGVLVKND